MVVLKFGGTSVANAENIKKVKEIVSSLDENRLWLFLLLVASLIPTTLHKVENGQIEFKFSGKRIENFVQKISMV